jgi:hypothetical protein
MKLLAIFCLIIVFTTVITAGCTVSMPSIAGTFVRCSDYQLITDVYKTPGPEYYVTYLVSFERFGPIPVTRKITESEYKMTPIGYYFSKSDFFWRPPVNLISVNESESGYRDACKVIP